MNFSIELEQFSATSLAFRTESNRVDSNSINSFACLYRLEIRSELKVLSVCPFKRRFLFQFCRPRKLFLSVWVFLDSVIFSTYPRTKLYYRLLNRKLTYSADATCNNLELWTEFLTLSSVYGQEERKRNRARTYNIDEIFYLANMLALLKYYKREKYGINRTYKRYRHTSCFYDTIQTRSVFRLFCMWYVILYWKLNHTQNPIQLNFSFKFIYLKMFHFLLMQWFIVHVLLDEWFSAWLVFISEYSIVFLMFSDFSTMLKYTVRYSHRFLFRWSVPIWDCARTTTDFYKHHEWVYLCWCEHIH